MNVIKLDCLKNQMKDDNIHYVKGKGIYRSKNFQNYLKINNIMVIPIIIWEINRCLDINAALWTMIRVDHCAKATAQDQCKSLTGPLKMCPEYKVRCFTENQTAWNTNAAFHLKKKKLTNKNDIMLV